MAYVSSLEASRSSKGRIPSPVLGMLIFVVTEIMFFSGMISTRIIIKASAGIFAPPENIKLPVLTTGFNTIVLLVSGILLVLAARKFGSELSKTLYAIALALGLFFVGVQGYEWFNLLSYGMTMTSNIFGATFYLLIGTHAVHAIAAIIALAFYYRKYTKDQLRIDQLVSLQILWGFVVLVWPILYRLVYF